MRSIGLDLWFAAWLRCPAHHLGKKHIDDGHDGGKQ